MTVVLMAFRLRSMTKQNMTLNCNGTLLSLEKPLVMGILNLTPDSFSDGGLFMQKKEAISHAEKMLSEGADIIDIGGYSSRPNAIDISVAEELNRIYDITQEILRIFPHAIISIDTFRSQVAQKMLDLGVHIINDISGGTLDENMHKIVAQYAAPYILMHIQGSPQTMQIKPVYTDVVAELRRRTQPLWHCGRVATREIFPPREWGAVRRDPSAPKRPRCGLWARIISSLT